MRILAVDFGLRRIGLALSDATATLARPWKTVPAGATPRASAALVAAELEALRDTDTEPTGIETIVVGVPRRLNGEDTDQTQPAREFAAALEAATRLTVREQDERLTSHEAEGWLAVRERDWRKRKVKLDAAAAAVMLQDYLDQQRAREAQP
jgi:putative Holliday junction resolvase